MKKVNHGQLENPERTLHALYIGGMVVARTMIDRALADQLRAACIAVALDLGGWVKKRKSKNDGHVR